MGDKIEMSLDDIIKTSKIGFRRGRGGSSGGGGGMNGRFRSNRGGGARGFQQGGNNRSFRSGGSGGKVTKGRLRPTTTRPTNKFPRGDVNSAWKHDMFEGGKKITRNSSGSGYNATVWAKLIVSNLDYGVSETDIHELFADFGPLKNASVHYDRSGRSLGTADVVFERRAHAVKAMQQYNGVPLDGRPMNIQLATSEVPSANPVRRTTGPPQTPNKRPRRVNNGRPNGQSGQRGGTKQAAPVKPSLEELDAELDAYVKNMKL